MENIIENNKLIAEFVGYEFINDKLQYEVTEENYLLDFMVIVYKFHRSWDWLMPVIENIESIIFDENNSFNVTIGATNYCVIQDSNGEVYCEVDDTGNSKLQTAYNAVIKFIKWYSKTALHKL